MDIILLLFVCPIVSAVVIIITIVNHVLLKKVKLNKNYEIKFLNC